MKLAGKIFFLLLLSAVYCHAQQNNLVQRIFLVGDAGQLQNGKHPVCDWLKQKVDWNDSKNTIIYLGNNIYPAGMPDEGDKNYNTAKEIIDYELSVVLGKNAKAFFVPGSRDWKQGKPGGLSQVQNEWQYINKLQLPNVQMLPANGCPGPVEVQIGDKVMLVFMDSQWWLQRDEKTGLESDCDFKTEDEVITALKDVIDSYPDKLILLAMNHPMFFHGKHSGYFSARQQYKNMSSRLEEILKQHSNIIYAAGHNHTLQFIRQDSVSFIISGTGSETADVKKVKNSLFAKNENGFAVAEVSADGKVAVKFYTLQSNTLQDAIFVTALNPLPIIKKEIVEETKTFPDSVTVIASDKFKSGGFRNFLLGKNYRREWGTPIRVKVIKLETQFGGLTPLKIGGGHQTKSLRFEDKNGKQYVLRLVEKSVTEAALPPEFRGIAVAKDLISDGVSASYPYAALSVPAFAKAVNVAHTNPTLVYVPDDPRLGKFRKEFSNTFCLLEERIPDPLTKKTYSTDEVADKLKEDNDNTVDQKAFLQARLLDMFMMDFDRHEDQWIWGAYDNGKGKIFFAMPRDRDQPFFVSKGLLPSFARKPWLSPQVQGFHAKAININTYNFNARNMDRAFLSEMNEDDWRKAVDNFLPKITDELIENALHQQPKEIQALPRNAEIIRKLKERKKYFANEMMEYYHFISKIVNITGSDKKELFNITRNDDGSVLVQVFKITKEGDQSTKMYERKFDPDVTKEIRLYGMGGDDKFITHGNGDKIKIRMIGGSGNDAFESNASTPPGKNIVYDLNTAGDQFAGNNNIRQKLSDDPDVNKYERQYYKYDLNIPFLSANYNPDDGVFLGLSLKFIRQGFRKTPYKVLNQISVNHALATKAYNFRYYSEFISAFGKKSDLLLDADIKTPNVANFFGYGNGTVFDKTKTGKIKYYRARYQSGDLSMMIRTKFTPWFSMTLGPTFQFYSLDSSDNRDRNILKTATNGLDPTTLFNHQSYIGGKLTLNVDRRNNKPIPTRGIYWLTSLKVLHGLNDASKNVTQLGTDISTYLSLNQQKSFVLAIRLGAAKNFGNGFEFYQAQYLGGTENLRGYRKYRFAGQSMAFNNIELRIKIANFNTYLFPGALGIFLFHDVGHVWAPNDFKISKWHTGYGGGFWFSPMMRLVITAAYTASKEEKLPLITLGWQF